MLNKNIKTEFDNLETYTVHLGAGQVDKVCVEYQEVIRILNKYLNDEWIPVKVRSTTEEEKRYYQDLTGEKETEIFDCKLPENGQEVLISTKYRIVDLVTFENDGVYCGFEDYDPEEVIAWMPMPDSYKI